jgi:hypothetical protein
MAKQRQPCRAGSATILRASAAALCCRSGDPASIARVFGRSVQVTLNGLLLDLLAFVC